MKPSILSRRGILWPLRLLQTALAVGLAVGCASNSIPSSSTSATSKPEVAFMSNQQRAELFVTTFYSWDAEALEQLLSPSQEADNVLYYQAWAQAANYAIKQRRPCTSIAAATAPSEPMQECRITVTDDFGRALGYTATDTFKLAFTPNKIGSVSFSGDDPPVFQQVFAWLMAEQPELFAGACKDMFAGGTQPAECAQAVAEGARAWALANTQPDE